MEQSWPALGEIVTLTTWCAGTGPAWAERRTDLAIEGKLMVEAVALWVPLDPSGRPMRLGEGFYAVYGEAVAGRKVSGRVPAAPPVPAEARVHPWPIRRTDLDVVGHVNNAAVWAALTEVVGESVASAALTHHGPVESGQAVTLATAPGRMWLVADGEVRCRPSSQRPRGLSLLQAEHRHCFSSLSGRTGPIPS